MGYPRRSRSADTEPPKPIDARATRRDISGNVTSEPGEKAYKGMHFGLDGKPISGTSLLTGGTVNFPRPAAPTGMVTGNPRVTFNRPGQVPTAVAAPGVVSAVPTATPAATGTPTFPKSRMTTGNPNVTFKGPEEMAADAAARRPAMTPEAKSNVFAAGRKATLATRPDIVTEGPTPVGAAGMKFPRSNTIVSPYGVASASPAKPAEDATMTAAAETGKGRFPKRKQPLI